MPAWMRPDCIAGVPPQTPGRILGSPQRAQRFSGCATKGKRGRGRHAGFGGTRARLPGPRALHSLLALGGRVGRRVGVVRSAAWAGTGALGSESSPGAGARPEPSSSSDSLLPIN